MPGRILPTREPRRSADGGPGCGRAPSSSCSSSGTSLATTTGRRRFSPWRWPPTGSTGGSRAGADATSALGSLLDPVADKLLVLSVLIVLVGRDVFAGWMVAAIVARELLISGLRLAALERGVVLQARDLGKPQDLDAGCRRSARRARSGRRGRRLRRLVGTARRARADLVLRARLLAARAAVAPRKTGRLQPGAEPGAGLGALEQPGEPPDAARRAIGPRHRRRRAVDGGLAERRLLGGGSGVISIPLPEPKGSRWKTDDDCTGATSCPARCSSHACSTARRSLRAPAPLPRSAPGRSREIRLVVARGLMAPSVATFKPERRAHAGRAWPSSSPA